MPRFLAIFLFVIFGGFVVLANLNGRIVGGIDSLEHTEYAVRIVSGKQGDTTGKLCTGVAISATRIITVAQAIFAYNYWVVGFNHRNVTQQNNQETSTAFHHPEYNKNTLANNIGIIYVETEITHFLSMIPNMPSYAHFKAMGYGVDESNVPVEMLQRQIFATVSRANCVAAYNAQVVHEDQFCGAAITLAHLAAGDQGGPVTNVYGSHLFGIVSFWDNNWSGNSSGLPAVFVNLYSHLDFIASHTSQSIHIEY